MRGYVLLQNCPSVLIGQRPARLTLDRSMASWLSGAGLADVVYCTLMDPVGHFKP
jgi:hypothetical protein